MRSIITLLLFVIALTNLSVKAQDTTNTRAPVDTTWKKGGFISISMNQVSLTNWAAGGENSFSGTFIGSFFANYKKGSASWDNTLDVAYGLLKSDGSDARKNEDKIELNSKYGRIAKGKLYYSALVNFKTQMAPGYNYPNDSNVISRLFAPAYLSLALGMDYKPKDYFSLFISPATGRFVFVLDQTLANAGQFGVNPGQNLRFEFGAYLRTRFQKNILKNLNLMTTLSLFNNYTDPIANQRANVNVDWETLITIKAGKLLAFSMYTHLLYDNNIAIPTYQDVTVGNTVYKNVVVAKGPKTQFQEALGIGISYKF